MSPFPSRQRHRRCVTELQHHHIPSSSSSASSRPLLHISLFPPGIEEHCQVAIQILSIKGKNNYIKTERKKRKENKPKKKEDTKILYRERAKSNTDWQPPNPRSSHPSAKPSPTQPQPPTHQTTQSKPQYPPSTPSSTPTSAQPAPQPSPYPAAPSPSSTP